MRHDDAKEKLVECLEYMQKNLQDKRRGSGKSLFKPLKKFNKSIHEKELANLIRDVRNSSDFKSAIEEVAKKYGEQLKRFAEKGQYSAAAQFGSAKKNNDLLAKDFAEELNLKKNDHHYSRGLATQLDWALKSDESTVKEILDKIDSKSKSGDTIQNLGNTIQESLKEIELSEQKALYMPESGPSLRR